MDQQIDLASVLKLAVNTIVTGREPGMACQQGLNRPFCKAHNSIFSRCVSAEPHIVDRVKTGLTEVLLDGFAVNLILDSADLNMSIAIVRERHNMSVCTEFDSVPFFHINEFTTNRYKDPKKHLG